MTDLWTIYFLQLSEEKYYVGRTKDLKGRIEQHKQGVGSEWTKRYPFQSVISVWHDQIPYMETALTIFYMERYGIDNVRGGVFSTVELSGENIKFIEQEIVSARDLCFRCRKRGHFVYQCTSSDTQACLTDVLDVGKTEEKLKDPIFSLDDTLLDRLGKINMEFQASKLDAFNRFLGSNGDYIVSDYNPDMNSTIFDYNGSSDEFSLRKYLRDKKPIHQVLEGPYKGISIKMKSESSVAIIFPKFENEAEIGSSELLKIISEKYHDVRRRRNQAVTVFLDEQKNNIIDNYDSKTNKFIISCGQEHPVRKNDPDITIEGKIVLVGKYEGLEVTVSEEEIQVSLRQEELNPKVA